MPIPDYETLMLPVLRAFGRGATSVREVLPDLIAEFALTEEEAAETIPSGSTTVLANRAHWARSYMGKAGLLQSPKRGQHVLTDKGRAVLASPPARIDNAFLAGLSDSFDDWRSAARQTRSPEAAAPPSPSAAPALTPDDAIQQAQQELERALEEELLSLVRQMDPIAFERLVLRVLQAMGYGDGSLGQRAQHTRASHDGGIDGIIHEDALGLDAVYVQVKRYGPENKVSRPAIQQFIGSLTGEGATKGVFVTASSFTAEAVEYLRRVPHRVVLIDGPRLAQLMIRHTIGVRVRYEVQIKAVDENTFAEM